jgi:TolB-like protein
MPSDREAHGDGGLADEPSAVVVRKALERILASAAFVASDRLKGFLRFVVEETLAGRADRLKAYTIALEVLGRDDSFDPQTDPVVRMEAGKLRRRLERYYLSAGQDDPVRIEIPKGGYVPTFSGQADADEAATAKPERDARSRGVWGSPLALAALVLAALVLAAVLLARFNDPTREAQAIPPVPLARGPAIIVLPFEDLSGSGFEAFAAGLTEELISNLMRFGELRLYSAYGSFLERPSADPVELGERLGVGYVIEGSVRRGPDRVRLIVYLIEADTGEHLWSQTYDRELTPENVFAVQEQLAADLAGQLAQPYGIINEVSAAAFRHQRPETLFAYDCVLRALDYRRMPGREKHAPVRACLEEAVRHDPGYADAWALLAFAYLDEFRFGHGPRPRDPAARDQALRTARHAVDLNPGNFNGLLALSAVQFYRGEFAEVDEIGRRLLALNPTNPEVLAQVGWRTAYAVDWDRGMALVRRAIDRSIKAPYWYHMFIALDHYRRGDYRAALAEASPFAGVGDVWAPLLLAAIHGQLGNRDAAQRALDRAIVVDPSAVQDPLAWLRRHNEPEDVIAKMVDGLIKAGLPALARTN